MQKDKTRPQKKKSQKKEREHKKTKQYKTQEKLELNKQETKVTNEIGYERPHKIKEEK